MTITYVWDGDFRRKHSVGAGSCHRPSSAKQDHGDCSGDERHESQQGASASNVREFACRHDVSMVEIYLNTTES